MCNIKQIGQGNALINILVVVLIRKNIYFLSPILGPILGPILSPILSPILGPILGPVQGPVHVLYYAL